MSVVAIIDYGSGNLRSAAKAFECAAARLADPPDIRVTSTPADLDSADRIVLPGVGAFAACKEGLQALDGILEMLDRQVMRQGKPFLGICVGMQLVADCGHEHGRTAGFGWIPGQVVSLAPSPATDGSARKIPHMGWNRLSSMRAHPVLDGVGDGSHVYFVHSFHMVPDCDTDLLATAAYGQTITAAIGRDNVVGTQFHPEKSQTAGMRLIGNFLSWQP